MYLFTTRGHTWSVKQAGIVLVLIAAVVGLYALPQASAEPCPQSAQWSCLVQVAAGEDVPEDFDDAAAAVNAEDDDADSNDAEADFESNVTSDGELQVRLDGVASDDQWEYDLLTSTRWSHDLIEFADDGRSIAVIFESEEASANAPRVMRLQPSRLQILNPVDEDVVFDVELPTEFRRAEWTDENRLVLIDADGALTVFGRS